MITYALALILATPAMACWLRRDLKRAVARQEFERQFRRIAADWQAFMQALGEGLLPTMERAARDLSRVFAAMRTQP